MRRLALLAALVAAACGRTPEAPERILLVSMDTVRADRVGGFGADAATPNLRAIADEGTRFTRFYAASSYTIPSHVAIFTGLDPASGARGHPGVPPEARTLAGRLRQAGYRTQGFHEGGFVGSRYGFARGFADYRRHPTRDLVGPGLESVLDWMREHAAEPYFLFVHTYAAHHPYGGYERYRRDHPERGLPSASRLAERARQGGEIPDTIRRQCALYNQLAPSGLERLDCGPGWLPADFPQTPHFELDRQALLASYDARIAQIDAAIGRMRDLLVELGEWDATLLVVTADHGEAFFEHGLYRHGYVPFDEVLRVPLLISYPRLLRDSGAREVRELAWHPDLLPTILGLAGVAAPAGLAGTDLGPALSGGSLGGERRIYPLVLDLPGAPGEPRRAVIQGDLKFVEGDARFGDPDALLFDLAVDPGERRNLRRLRPEALRRLAAAARERRELYREARQGPVPGAPSEEELRDLCALGYLEDCAR